MNFLQLHGGKHAVHLQLSDVKNTKLLTFRTQKNSTSFQLYKYQKN